MTVFHNSKQPRAPSIFLKALSSFVAWLQKKVEKSGFAEYLNFTDFLIIAIIN